MYQYTLIRLILPSASSVMGRSTVRRLNNISISALLAITPVLLRVSDTACPLQPQRQRDIETQAPTVGMGT